MTRLSLASAAPVTVLVAVLAVALAAPRASAQEAAPSTAFVRFVERPGATEFTGVLCARPIQPESAESLGLTSAELERRVLVARAALGQYELREYVAATDEYLFFVPNGETETSVANRLLGFGGFEYVEPDWLVFPILCPDDTQFGQQWHHQAARMQSCDAWDIETGDPSIVVAICDTGLFVGHSDLQLHRQEGYNVPSATWEFAGGDISDVNGHGTYCTGTAAANGDNGNGVSGVGWNLGHRIMRVTNNSSGGASLSALTMGARTAADAGDKVASVSYSGVTSSSVNTAGTYVRSRGALLIWAAGNDSDILSGNRDDDVIVVAATTSSDSLAGYSNRGSFVDLSAPGSGIRTTNRNGGYSSVSGTSFACPMTAGLCALIWSRNPMLTPQEVENILRMSCDDLGTVGVDDVFGHGRINSFQALQMTPNATVSISFPNGLPMEIAPAGGDVLDVLVTPGADAADTSGAVMWVDAGVGFVALPAAYVGGNTFRGTFPPATCPTEVDYYFEFQLLSGASVTAPAGGASTAFSVLSVERTILLSDSLESASGWVAGVPGDDATTGIWTRVDPIGTAAQPEDDHTAGGTLCFVTGQGTAGGSLGQNDVDNGSTTLLTPTLDLSLTPDPYIGYWRWYSNAETSNIDDRFVIDITDDGGATWTNVETLGPNAVSGGWVHHTFRLRDFVTPTNDVQMRFIASDLGIGSIVEAAIDDFEVFEQCPGLCGMENYCVAQSNSTGGVAFIGATGSTSFAANDLVLFAGGAPSASVGLLVYSPDRASTPLGNGTLCLGGQTLGTVIREAIVSFDLLGNTTYAFDNTAPPIPLGQVAAGETWNFQFVYRDNAAGGALFNLTDGLAVTFCP